MSTHHYDLYTAKNGNGTTIRIIGFSGYHDDEYLVRYEATRPAQDDWLPEDADYFILNQTALDTYWIKVTNVDEAEDDSLVAVRQLESRIRQLETQVEWLMSIHQEGHHQ